MSKLKVNPTGCPGPIPGTKVWRCDGLNCVYGQSHYASCKQAIKERGYTLRLSSDLIAEANEEAELIKNSVQAQLQDEQKVHAQTKQEAAQSLANAQAEQHYFAEQYVEAVMQREHFKDCLWTATQTNQHQSEQIEEQQEHIADLLAQNAQLQHELRWIYAKQGREEGSEESTDSSVGELSGSDSSDTTVGSTTVVEEQD